jgi:hypothetical protein
MRVRLGRRFPQPMLICPQSRTDVRLRRTPVMSLATGPHAATGVIQSIWSTRGRFRPLAPEHPSITNRPQ